MTDIEDDYKEDKREEDNDNDDIEILEAHFQESKWVPIK